MRTELSTTLKRHTSQILSDLERDKQPIMITHHGLPSAFLVDVETFELQQRRMTILEALARGERDIAEGRVFSHEEVEKRMGKWLK
jgi:prevent-host-death family protein